MIIFTYQWLKKTVLLPAARRQKVLINNHQFSISRCRSGQPRQIKPEKCCALFPWSDHAKLRSNLFNETTKDLLKITVCTKRLQLRQW
jgi:hypothetical protein